MSAIVNTFVIGLTGGIGSGKTAASDWFSEQGITIVDADVIAREVVAVGSDCLRHIAQQLGSWALTESGELNRRALREYVFTNPDARKTLENITHPAIHKLINQQLSESKSPFTILVVPLLFEGGETGLVRLCQRTLIVDVPVELQIKRASKRDTQSLDQIKNIIQTQISRQERRALADDIVDNSSDLSSLYSQLEPLYKQYIQLSQER